MDKENVYIYTMECCSALKRGEAVICDNMDELENIMISENKARYRKPNPYDLAYVKSQKVELIEVASRMIITRA
jgi:hypothetical protein